MNSIERVHAVSRFVPQDWTFEIFSPGEGPVFRRTTHRHGDVDRSGDSRAVDTAVCLGIGYDSNWQTLPQR